MLLAAGLGTRMRPLTLLRPKPALPVLNRPLVGYTLEALARVGVREVVVNTHHLAAAMRRAARAACPRGMRLRFSHEPEILGSAGGVRKLRRWLGDEPFLLLNADMVFDFELRSLVELQRRSGARAVVSLQPPRAAGRYGAVVTDARGRLLSFGGWPRPPAGHRAWHFTGIHVMDPAILDRLRPGYAETARDLYGPLISDGEPVLGKLLRGPWYDLSSPALYLASQRALLRRGFGSASSGRAVAAGVRAAASARVEGSVVGAGCRIGPGARVRDSVLWEGVVVAEGARVEGSILADGARIEAGERVEDEIVLRRGRATAGLGGLQGGQHRLALGD
ncbi:MAG: sugar phosphate nucleotidyltransferase [Vicinamibacteria bacterium]